MNILYFANPNSIHDEKWISHFSNDKLNNTYILQRVGQVASAARQNKSAASLLEPIPDFSIVRLYQTLCTALRIRSIVKKHNIDLIHILYAEPNALWCLFKIYFKVPMIISTRGTDVLKTIPEVFELNRMINYLVAPAYRRAFLNADWVTSTSSKQVKSIVSFSGRVAKNSVVRTGVDINKWSASSLPKSSLLGNSNYILFPRFIQPVYNHEFCLDAIALLPSTLKKEYKMVFLGLNSGDIAYQEVLRKKMGEIHDVEFVFLEKQSQDALFGLYKNASLVVMSPLSDGSPVSAMEAMMCKVPVIIPPLDYDPEIFHNTAFTFKSWNTTELAQLMEMLLMGGSAVSAQIEKAYLIAMKLGNSYTEMEKVSQLYKSLIK